jgi:hypothetical protein
MRMAATTAVVAGTATAVAGHHAQKNAQQAATAAPPEAAPAAAEPAEDTYEQLEKLGKLHEQGILTDEEFAAQKAKLLA